MKTLRKIKLFLLEISILLTVAGCVETTVPAQEKKFDQSVVNSINYIMGTDYKQIARPIVTQRVAMKTKDENGEWRYEVDKVERNCCVVFFAYNNNSCFKIADNSVNDIDDKAYFINEETAVCQLSDDELDLIDSVWNVDTKKGTILKMTN